MSKALNYLMQTRGDTLGPYFKFLKQAGSNLDPKTRALVSLIGKVHAQSEAGLRQYLPRALRDGASAAEIIDVLLFSLPILGLPKINWAIEIILSMDIPEFSPELIDQQPTWQPLIDASELIDGQPQRLELAGRAFFVLRQHQEITVYDSRCPHQVTNIPELALAQTELTCPKHNWVFDLKSGACIANGRHPLRKFDHRLNDAGELEVFC